MNFSDLEVVKEVPKGKVIMVDTSIYHNKPNIQKIDFKRDILKKIPKRTKAELRLIEPGVKVGTGQFLSVAQWCDSCEKVQSMVHKPSGRKMICLSCKVITKY